MGSMRQNLHFFTVCTLCGFFVACARKAIGTDGEKNTAESVSEITVGSAFTRKCSAYPDGTTLLVKQMRCKLSGSESLFVIGYWDEQQGPLFTVGFESLQLGTRLTGTTTGDHVNLYSACAARATVGSPEPCEVELVELVRGTKPAYGEVETGSMVHLRIACPPTLMFWGSDYEWETTQTPQRWEVKISDCVVY
jgi:hypothetical protein